MRVLEVGGEDPGESMGLGAQKEEEEEDEERKMDINNKIAPRSAPTIVGQLWNPAPPIDDAETFLIFIKAEWARKHPRSPELFFLGVWSRSSSRATHSVTLLSKKGESCFWDANCRARWITLCTRSKVAAAERQMLSGGSPRS